MPPRLHCPVFYPSKGTTTAGCLIAARRFAFFSAARLRNGNVYKALCLSSWMLLETGESRLCAAKICLEPKLAREKLRANLVVSVSCRYGEPKCTCCCYFTRGQMSAVANCTCIINVENYCSMVLTHALWIAMGIFYLKSSFYGLGKCGGVHAASGKFKNRAELFLLF